METTHRKLENLKPLGGCAVLDFVNTVHSRLCSPQTGEYLNTPEDVVKAQVIAGLVPAAAATPFLAACRADPGRAAGLLASAIQLREALYRIFIACARGGTPAGADLETLNTMLARLRPRQRLRRQGNGFTWEWELDAAQPETVLGPAAGAAAELLTSDRIGRVKECPGPDGCGWLFLDTSRNRSRHWCSMSDCGNVAKVRRHRRRRRSA